MVGNKKIALFYLSLLCGVSARGFAEKGVRRRSLHDHVNHQRALQQSTKAPSSVDTSTDTPKTLTPTQASTPSPTPEDPCYYSSSKSSSSKSSSSKSSSSKSGKSKKKSAKDLLPFEGKGKGKGGGGFEGATEYGKGKGGKSKGTCKSKKSSKKKSSKGKGGKGKGSNKRSKKSGTRKSGVRPPPVMSPTPAPSVSPPTFTQPPVTGGSGDPPTPSPASNMTSAPSVSPAPTPTPPTFVQLSRFGLLYTVTNPDPPFRSEYLELAEVTSSYLEEYFQEVFAQTTLSNLDDFVTEFVGNLFTNNEPIQVDFDATAAFEPTSSFVPSPSDLDIVLANAFNGANLDTYLALVTALPQDNVFSSTQAVALTNSNIPQTSSRSDESGTTPGAAGSNSGSRSGATGTLGIAGAAAAGFVLVVAGVVYYRRRDDEEEMIEGKFDDEKLGHMTVAGETCDESLVTEQYEQNQYKDDDRSVWGDCSLASSDAVHELNKVSRTSTGQFGVKSQPSQMLEPSPEEDEDAEDDEESEDDSSEEEGIMYDVEDSDEEGAEQDVDVESQERGRDEHDRVEGLVSRGSDECSGYDEIDL